MNRLEDFVRAIVADPANAILRAVFADWLEEQGDSRASQIRELHDRLPYAARNSTRVTCKEVCWANFSIKGVWRDKSELPKWLWTFVKSYGALFTHDNQNGDEETWFPSTERSWSIFGQCLAQYFGVTINAELKA